MALVWDCRQDPFSLAKGTHNPGLAWQHDYEAMDKLCYSKMGICLYLCKQYVRKKPKRCQVIAPLRYPAISKSRSPRRRILLWERRRYV